MIAQHQLDSYVGKSIGEICQNGYASPADDHGAHFVSHVLGYQFGVTCQMMGNGKGAGATLRVHEMFRRCPSIGVWSLRPSSLHACLVFTLRASSVNLAGRTMGNAPRKHVGIFQRGFIWHYSNALGRVVKQAPPQFARCHPSPDNAMFYGSLP